jgi:hypothetical protein
MNPQKVTEELELTKLKDKIWYVVPSCATTGEGLLEGLVRPSFPLSPTALTRSRPGSPTTSRRRQQARSRSNRSSTRTAYVHHKRNCHGLPFFSHVMRALHLHPYCLAFPVGGDTTLCFAHLVSWLRVPVRSARPLTRRDWVGKGVAGWLGRKLIYLL